MVGQIGNNSFTWNPAGGAGAGGGGNVNFTSLTYAAAATLIGSSGLVAGSFYKITDRGDQGILLQAVNTTTFAPQGVRYMLCPAFYQAQTTGGNTWLGIWYPTIAPAIGDLAIWGGLVWRNQTGAAGNSTSDIALDAVNWAVVAKATFAAGEYVPLKFGILYDFTNDWIDRQWDDYGNIFGLSFLQESQSAIGYNLCDVSDWNLNSITPGVITFYNNNCFGFYNNAGTTQAVGNKCLGRIFNNIFVQTLGGNSCSDIYNNDATLSGGMNITNNKNFGSITNNGGAALGAVDNNSNNGNIDSNTNAGQINHNLNNGNIDNNACNDGGGQGSITFNSNDGDITGNSNGGHIRFNRNEAPISTNSNVGDISSNTNNGLISNNANTGDILGNSNNGDILLNGLAVTDILSNSNNGDIANNVNVGAITGNGNNGAISNNAATVTDITNNVNNGAISGNSASIGVVAITTNTNNGLISGAFAADVTDPVVDKT